MNPSQATESLNPNQVCFPKFLTQGVPNDVLVPNAVKYLPIKGPPTLLERGPPLKGTVPAERLKLFQSLNHARINRRVCRKGREDMSEMIIGSFLTILIYRF